MELDEALFYVKQELPKERYEHTYRVVQEALKLAKIHGVDEYKASIAAAFHDYAKKRPVEQLKRIILSSTLPKDILNYNQELWHGPVASILIEPLFGISDAGIKDAIKFHTTGRAYMSQLEMVINLADYIEPHRQFEGIDEVRALAQEDLIKASWLMLKNTIVFLMEKKSTIHPDTFYAYNYLCIEIAQRNES